MDQASHRHGAVRRAAGAVLGMLPGRPTARDVPASLFKLEHVGRVPLSRPGMVHSRLHVLQGARGESTVVFARYVSCKDLVAGSQL